MSADRAVAAEISRPPAGSARATTPPPPSCSCSRSERRPPGPAEILQRADAALAARPGSALLLARGGGLQALGRAEAAAIAYAAAGAHARRGAPAPLAAPGPGCSRTHR